MRTTRLVAGWSAIVLISGAGAGCSAGTRYAPDGLRSGLAETTPQEERALRDSARAQQVADEVGPRVSVMADFEDASGTRRVDATFHMSDDAYVIVGQLDASGRLTVVFPSAPGDDGFVRGDEIYHVPPFFAGFGDEYAWRYSNYQYTTHSAASRYNSYDAGMGYVFVIASWRPMRLDRITNGNKWESYEVSDINYMSDPREAIEELGSLVAGDNREAYTIEYAHYTTTNYGNYAYSDFDRYNSSCSAYGASPFLGYRPMLFSPYGMSPYGAFGLSSFGCGNGLGYAGYYGVGYPIYAAPGQAPLITGPRPRLPLGMPILHLPLNDPNGLALHLPQRGTFTPGGHGSVDVYGSIYRRPGLLTEDAPGSRVRGGQWSGGTQSTFAPRRPSIQDMIGARSANEGTRDISGRGAAINTPAGWASPNRANGVTRGGQSGRWSNGGTQATAGQSGRSYGGTQAHSGARSEGGHAAPTHASPSGGGHAAAAPTHAEPARSAPSSSSGSKKP
jgi:hypothetical protein